MKPNSFYSFPACFSDLIGPGTVTTESVGGEVTPHIEAAKPPADLSRGAASYGLFRLSEKVSAVTRIAVARTLRGLGGVWMAWCKGG